MTNLHPIDDLATRAATVAMTAAADYVRANNLRATLDVDALVAALKSEVGAAIGPALDDARAAHEAGMGGYATPTFLASMKLAGIRAAKSVTVA